MRDPGRGIRGVGSAHDPSVLQRDRRVRKRRQLRIGFVALTDCAPLVQEYFPGLTAQSAEAVLEVVRASVGGRAAPLPHPACHRRSPQAEVVLALLLANCWILPASGAAQSGLDKTTVATRAATKPDLTVATADKLRELIPTTLRSTKPDFVLESSSTSPTTRLCAPKKLLNSS